jgi:hypothetical protein
MFFEEHEDTLSRDVNRFGDPCSVRVVLSKGYVVLDIGF